MGDRATLRVRKPPVAEAQAQWLLPEEAAAQLRVSTRTLRRYIHAGLPHVRLGEGGRTVRFRAAEIEAWMQLQRQGGQ